MEKSQQLTEQKIDSEIKPKPVESTEEAVQLPIINNNLSSDDNDVDYVKEKELVKRLEAKHCRPLVNLCKLMASEGFVEKVEDIDDATSRQRT